MKSEEKGQDANTLFQCSKCEPYHWSQSSKGKGDALYEKCSKPRKCLVNGNMIFGSGLN